MIFVVLASFFAFSQTTSATSFSTDDGAQKKTESNRFDENNGNVDSQEAAAKSGPGDPGDDDMPIDQYVLPLLLLGAGMIVYVHYRKKTKTE